MPSKRKVPSIRDKTAFLLDTVVEAAESQTVERPLALKGLRIGTSAFTAAGWETAFYPAGTQPRDYLTYYATQFNTVEVDSTFYPTPSATKSNSNRRASFSSGCGFSYNERLE